MFKHQLEGHVLEGDGSYLTVGVSLSVLHFSWYHIDYVPLLLFEDVGYFDINLSPDDFVLLLELDQFLFADLKHDCFLGSNSIKSE